MTEDIDVCVRAADLLRCRDLLTDNGYVGAPGCARRFVDAQTDVTIDVLISGKVVGHRPEQQQITFPDPAEAEPHAGIPVPSLPRLIELKLGLWRFKDWGDVIELIRELELARSFAERLSPSLRPLYFDCYERRIEEDQYDPQIRDGAPQPYSEASAAGS